jgi:hypothetical protein
VISAVPPAIRNEAFLKAIAEQYHTISFSNRERLFHGHGQRRSLHAPMCLWR